MENPLDPLFSNTFDFSQSRRSDIGIKRKNTRLVTSDVIVATDGTGDFDDIQSAIDFLEGGGTIQIKEGTYNITEAININKSLTLAGNGKETILKINSAISTISITANNITIRDLKILGTYSGPSGAEEQTGISFSTCNNIVITNCTLEKLKYGFKTSSTLTDININNNFLFETNYSFYNIKGTGINVSNNFSPSFETFFTSGGLEIFNISNNYAVVGTFFTGHNSDTYGNINNNVTNEGCDSTLKGYEIVFSNNNFPLGTITCEADLTLINSNQVGTIHLSGEKSTINANIIYYTGSTNTGTANTNIWTCNNRTTSSPTFTTTAKHNSLNSWN